MPEDFIIGYQFGPDKGEFRGEYKFPNNMDKVAIHVPPFTTLVAPPKKIPEGEHPCWDGKKWVLMNDQNLSGIKPTKPTNENLKGLRREFVEENVSRGMWPRSVLEEYDAAVAADNVNGSA